MDTANYLRNQLPTRRKDPIFILEETWINKRQNLGHVRIFCSRVITFIPSKKRTKSDVQKTWKGIFIGYTRIFKHLRVWAPRTHQVLIASKPIVNKSKKGTNLLVEYPLPPSDKLLRLQTSELKLQSHFCKNAVEKYFTAKTSKGANIENILSKEDVEKEVAQAIMQTKRMKIHLPCDLKTRIDQDRISSKNPLGDRLVKTVTNLQSQLLRQAAKCMSPRPTIR